MEQLLPAILALGAVCVAIYTDLSKRIIPNRLTFPLIGFGVIFYVALGILDRNFWMGISGAVGATIAFAIGYFMWLAGGWAGGDVKLFTALGALLPNYESLFISAPYASAPCPFFALTIIFNGLIVISPLLLVYGAICRVRGRAMLYDRTKITELKEGMIPAEMIYKKNGKVNRKSLRLGLKPKCDRIYANPSRAAGFTRYQLGALKRVVLEGRLENQIRVKKGMPFAPALGVGVFVGVLYGDLYWALLLALV